MTEPIALLNGRIVPASEAKISVCDTGFVHGAAVAEMLRTFRHRPFRVEDHLGRLQRGIAALGLSDDAPSSAELKDAIAEVVTHNSGLIPPQHDLGIILFVTAGMNATYFGLSSGFFPMPSSASAEKSSEAFDENIAKQGGLPRCTWGVHTFPLPFELWAEKMQHGVPLIVSPHPSVPPECLDPTIKWRSRVHWFTAERAVRRENPQASALFCNLSGSLTETSTANVFLVKEGCLFTPRAEETLDGISRRVVFELAERLAVSCAFADVSPEDAFAADEMFLTSTPFCLMPVASVNGHPVGDVVPGPLFRQLMDAWNDAVGLNIIQQIVRGAEERISGRADPSFSSGRGATDEASC